MLFSLLFLIIDFLENGCDKNFFYSKKKMFYYENYLLNAFIRLTINNDFFKF